ncbi:protein IN2-1 homolog B isoform X2 [Beta vulgaris subsp. vulgaris]|uniref:protein IN2-1 homolog B isoform X2 n=1 Tax=Beta vulgaris subsp. vulgaris TaxID=3555 RepID=UPI0025499761|nr:protein IN2-1 homolog B isoform X2 [Beta vulgaris subsp. vulgaris]
MSVKFDQKSIIKDPFSSIYREIQEVLPPFLSSNSDPPALFDGTTRLYVTYYCPFAQRAWLTRNYKGLHDKIQLVPIDLDDRPTWYKEKVNPANKVPALEHNNNIIVESLDLIKYIDANFEGPSLFPDDHAKKEYTEELFVYSDKWNPTLFFYLRGTKSEDEMRAAFDKFEELLSKYNHEGPFLLGAQFSAADVVYAPFLQRYLPLFIDLHKYDITEGRPKLAAWLKALDTIEAFQQTKWDEEQNVKIYKRRNLGIV